MPWGTGRAWTTILAAEHSSGPAEPVVHMVPSVWTAAQAAAEGRTRSTHQVLVAVAPPQAGRPRHEDHHAAEGKALDAPDALAQALAYEPQAALVCPCDSAHLLRDAQRHDGAPQAALAILHAVHRSAQPATGSPQATDWRDANERAFVRARPRLGLSARPSDSPPRGSRHRPGSPIPPGRRPRRVGAVRAPATGEIKSRG